MGHDPQKISFDKVYCKDGRESGWFRLEPNLEMNQCDHD